MCCLSSGLDTKTGWLSGTGQGWLLLSWTQSDSDKNMQPGPQSPYISSCCPNPVLGCEPFDPFTSLGLGSAQGVSVLLIDKCGAVLQLPTQVKLLSLQQATRQRENQNKSTIRTAGWRVDGTQSLMDPWAPQSREWEWAEMILKFVEHALWVHVQTNGYTRDHSMQTIEINCTVRQTTMEDLFRSLVKSTTDSYFFEKRKDNRPASF